MRNLWVFISKYSNWFLFVVLEVASLVLLFQFNSYQGSVYFSSANVVTGRFHELRSQVEAFFSLTTINGQLTQRNLYLERQVKMLSERLTSLTGDSNIVSNSRVKLLANYQLIPAQVVSNSIDKKDNFITLNKGRADGVRKDMGVACGNGVVGVVFMVSEHYCVVIPALSSKSNISVMIDKRGYYGYLHWTGGDAGFADMDDVPRHAHFRIGDRIVTSGYSSIFPPGVLVGQVKHVYNSADGLSYRVQVRLSTDFGNLRDVCIIDNSVMKERIELMRAVQDSIQPKGN